MQVQLENRDGVALIQFDDGKKNAITPEAAAQILAGLEEAEANADAIVIAGRPGSFCAGFELATICLLYTSPSPRDGLLSRMPSSA